jgi:undecaprenyl-diphosphatase
MALLEIVILAIIQGIAEFLPISSSGHVVVAAAAFNRLGHPMQQMVTLNIVLHLGTLGAILVFYWGRICRLLGEDRRLIPLLVVGTLPAVFVGLPTRRYFEGALESPALAGCMFLVTGAMLAFSPRIRQGQLGCRKLTYGQALLVGLFQALAVLPGVSRSGATIVAGLGCGLKREEAAAFSFLLAIPIIGGAGLMELVGVLLEPSGAPPWGLLGLGAGLSFAVGLASLAWLLRWVRKGRLHHFAWWVIPLGIAVIGCSLLGL